MKKHLQRSQAIIQSCTSALLLVGTLLIICNSFSLAEIRYVSKTGSSTPPYTSWETASDSIQKCINISQFGDTIYVANGVYKEQVVMIPGLSLIGAGMDSCVIDMTDRQTYVNAVEMKDSCLFKGFKIAFAKLLPAVRGLGILMPFYQDTVQGCNVNFNRIDYPETGMVITDGNIKNNFIYESRLGMLCGILDGQNQHIAYIDYNLISFYVTGIKVAEKTIVDAQSNIFILESEHSIDGEVLQADLLSNSANPKLENNNIIKGINDVIFRRAIVNAYFGNFTNNQFLAQFEDVFYTAPANIKNNNVIGSLNAIYGDTTNVKYNNFWKTGDYPKDSTNISVDPMFVNDTSDFHLQMFSPLIDAGDPNILDKDGSRSDIGLYGGPNGEKYTYRDLAPKPPSNLTAQYDSGLVKLTWNRNTEADFFHYRVYRDTVPDFMYDTTKIIAVLPDTVYYDDLPEIYLAGNYYYKVTALDSTGHQSAPGEEVHINITGIPEGPPVVVEHYQLLNNYPNPFNPSTIIPYRLKEPGCVKLYIYDIKGELVRVLVNEYQNRGYYEVVFRPTTGERKQVETGEEYWTGYNDDIASGMYIYQLMVKGEGNIPVFTGMGKMILLK